jgi:hypothetical protein
MLAFSLRVALLVWLIGCGASPKAEETRDVGPDSESRVPDSSSPRGDDGDAVSDDGDAVSEDGDARLLVDGGSDAGTAPPASEPIVIDGCLGQTGVAERCTLITNASACTTTPCSKLVVVFSGGEMGCATGAGYGDVLAGYASKGYAAVCINYFDTSTGSGTAPYIDEAARIDIAVREATTGTWAQAYWTGRDLLFEGISHGATAPVILMTRTDLDDQPHWRGSHFTAGCFFDGSYDQVATAKLLESGALGGKPCTIPVSHSRGLERYCGDQETGTTCDLTTNAKAQADTITDVLPATFAIADFKMFECGSALPACSGDIIPGPPIQQLCQRLDQSPTHTCTFVSLPTDGHLKCHVSEYDQCRTWFEEIMPP